MANTPQAKKRIRRNANREIINHSRISRIRTFIKQVEIGDRDGQEGRCRGSVEGGSAGDGTRRCARRYPQEHGRSEDFPAIQEGCVARLKSRAQKRVSNGPSGNRRPVCFGTVKKMQQFPRFAQIR